MGFLDKFKEEKDLSSGLDLPDHDDDLDLDDDSSPALDADSEAPGESTINSDPSFGGGSTDAGQDDDLRDDVKLVLEKLDTVKSQLQHVQSRLDQLEAEHGSNRRR